MVFTSLVDGFFSGDSVCLSVTHPLVVHAISHLPLLRTVLGASNVKTYGLDENEKGYKVFIYTTGNYLVSLSKWHKFELFSSICVKPLNSTDSDKFSSMDYLLKDTGLQRLSLSFLHWIQIAVVLLVSQWS